MPKPVMSSYCKNCIGSIFIEGCALYTSCDRFGICERCCSGCDRGMVTFRFNTI